MAEGRPETMRYTGKFFEADHFGESGSHGSAYMPYADAVEDVKNNQLGDPTDPKTRFANDLHFEVIKELGLEDDEWSKVAFYTAVGSSLDKHHGVDGFFEFDGARVTLDITQNPAKAGGYKADFIVGPEEVEYEKRRQELAQEIADQLRERIAERQRRKHSGYTPLRRRPR